MSITTRLTTHILSQSDYVLGQNKEEFDAFHDTECLLLRPGVVK